MTRYHCTLELPYLLPPPHLISSVDLITLDFFFLFTLITDHFQQTPDLNAINMALVNYSDSESDGETAPAPATATTAKATTKPAFQKAAPGRLQVSLPSLKPEVGLKSNDAELDGPPAKRARTGGAFSGFNALLPAPKKAVVLKKGVNLKTSSEAAFSRNPLPQQTEDNAYTAPDLSDVGEKKAEKHSPPPEPKIVGKATRFLPLSVSSKKKKKPLPKIPASEKIVAKGSDSAIPKDVATEVEPVQPKPKKSLFSVISDEQNVPIDSVTGDYEPITIESTRPSHHGETSQPLDPQPSSAPTNPNSLEAVAASMNLTPAQRRHLFGRNGKDANVTHFDMDAQYATNERARQAGEVVEHRAVKAIAPGKHSLQQLVNNAQTQQEALKDKWADGKRARGEGGSKYGWST